MLHFQLALIETMLSRDATSLHEPANISDVDLSSTVLSP